VHALAEGNAIRIHPTDLPTRDSSAQSLGEDGRRRKDIQGQCDTGGKGASGVLSEAMRGDYVQRLHQAVSRSKEANDQRIVMTSIILDEVNDGLWGANGAIWYLADFTQAAGYRHLQGLTGK
jgi:hypothetical protein